jgi:hypothetical protein
MNDPLIRAIANLPLAAPDANRSAQVRARCHARLGRMGLRRSPGRAQAKRPLWAPAFVVLGVLYVGQSLYLALRLAGVM